MKIDPIWLIVLSGALALLPLLAGLATAFVKVSIVLGMLRSALGAQQVPSALVTAALSAALTLQIMAPIIERTRAAALQIDWERIETRVGLSSLPELQPLLAPWRSFMARHCGVRELRELERLGAASEPAREKLSAGAEPEPPLSMLAAAFLLTELKEAFAMGFVLLLPFLVIDLITANVLAGMGMYMLSPTLIALPLKLLIFVLSDGWLLLAKALVHSYS